MKTLGEDMPVKKEKLDIITFKVPESLREAMKGIPNRSEFIRAAVVAALDSVCPLCRGTGVIMPNQRPHWDLFVTDHHFEECETCNAVHVVCDRTASSPEHIHEGD
jgi:hypothetical protein